MVFKSLNGLVPEYLTSKFVTRNESTYALRDSVNKLVVPFPRTKYMKNSFSYSGATLQLEQLTLAVTLESLLH